MKKEDVVLEVGRPFLRPFSVAQLLFLLGFVASPFIWIWDTWDMAWKTGLTGIVGFALTALIYDIIKKAIKNEVDKAEDAGTKKTSFQERIEQLKKMRENI